MSPRTCKICHDGFKEASYAYAYFHGVTCDSCQPLFLLSPASKTDQSKNPRETEVLPTNVFVCTFTFYVWF